MSLHVDQQNTYQHIISTLSNIINIENPTLVSNPLKTQKSTNSAKTDDISQYVTQVSHTDAYNHFNALYHAYASIYIQLNTLVDQLLHVQQKLHCLLLIQLVVLRLLQCRHECMKLCNNGEWTTDYPIHYTKVIPDPHIPLPLYCNDICTTHDARQLINDTMKEYGGNKTITNMDNVTVTSNTTTTHSMTLQHAITILQKFELVRQAKQQYDTKLIQYNNTKLNQETHSSTKIQYEPNDAALMIQRLFRGYSTRKSVLQLRDIDNQFIGLTYSNVHSKTIAERVNEIRLARKQRQQQLQSEYNNALVELQSELKLQHTVPLSDELWDTRYKWYIEQKLQTGKYPKDFNGFYAEKNKLIEEEEKQAIPDNKPAQSTAPTKNTRGKQATVTVDSKNSITISTTPAVSSLYNAIQLYQKYWLQPDNTLIQPSQFEIYNRDMAVGELMPQVEQEIRETVDQTLAAHLQQITLSMQKPKKKKKFKKKTDGTKPSTAVSKPKTAATTTDKPKKKKKKAAKVKQCCEIEKPLQPVLHDYIQVLTKWSILIDSTTYKQYTLDTYIGNTTLQRVQHNNTQNVTITNLQPTVNDLTDTLLCYTVLPLGSNTVHNNVVQNISSVLLYGATGTGKRHLTYAMANASNAVLLDISVNTLKYRLTSKLEIYKLIHIIMYVALAVQPCILYISDVASLCVKTPNDKKSKQTRVSTEIDKYRQCIIQHITFHCTKSNQLQLIGNIVEPICDTVDTPQLLQLFPKKSSKMLYIPLPCYSTRLQYMQQYIQQYIDTTHSGNKVSSIKPSDMNMFAYITDGYTIGALKHTLDTVLQDTKSHNNKQRAHSIHINELLHCISNCDVVYSTQYDRYVQFNNIVTGDKERKRVNDLKQKLNERNNANKTVRKVRPI